MPKKHTTMKIPLRCYYWLRLYLLVPGSTGRGTKLTEISIIIHKLKSVVSFLLWAGWLWEDGLLAQILLHLYEAICSLRRRSGGMRGRKQSGLMTQHHPERALFLSFKEQQDNADKALKQPNPPPVREEQSPTHFSLHGLLSDHSISNRYVCMCSDMGVCGWQGISSVHRDALKVLSWKRQPAGSFTEAISHLLTWYPCCVCAPDSDVWIWHCNPGLLVINATLPLNPSVKLDVQHCML